MHTLHYPSYPSLPQILTSRKQDDVVVDHGAKVPMDRRGSLLVSNPSDSFTLLAMNSVFLVRSAKPFTPPSPQASLMTWTQLQMPSTQPTQDRAQLNRQYLMPRVQFQQALAVSPSLQSMQRGAQRVQQQASQQRQASPQASMECHWSMHMAVLQAAYPHQQHWQHFLRNYIGTELYDIMVDRF